VSSRIQGSREYPHKQSVSVVFRYRGEWFRFPAADPAGTPQRDQRIEHVIRFGTL
jgi:hypothetical protein